MSAQNSGRQSPPPETQSGAQQQDPPRRERPSPSFVATRSIRSLESNPKHPLEDIEAAKYSKVH
ncbi:uncharacterized protein P174DRAFT_447393 [Aspergillus novofumigatus IBT 16806]|uniref:Uncharacterized protein n=1 Tax=Aspergillus novofumigatus (strain IBT 16806) TaxID=1392255 RepID=A0A2I1CMG6_ASPN1|nr:uncharacterized protein P174DRAFT_447393 [Aspergillus novofumigatus IBT 16806]PKX98814.1 hypothetical protein P174DRAFT_447393 [Aspergillus novofumigatus IBT 16806]